MSNVIDGFEQLTPQQCFDMAARHVLANGRPSIDESGSCCYTGIGCAAAPFLTEEGKRQNWAWGSMPGRPDTNEDLIGAMQDAHDYADRAPDRFVDDFKDRMRQLAEDRGLSTAVLDSPQAGSAGGSK
jgi:hypothetical protein